MVRIRRALSSDPAAIARSQVAAWHMAYAGLIPAAYLADYTVAMRTERWERILRAPLPGGVTLVGEVAGVVEGFASIADARDEDVGGGELVALYVHPACWETGLGHALHEAALDHLVAGGHVRAVLWVLEGNARASAFYQRHGWRPDGSGKIEDFAGVAVAEVRLVRGLGAGPSSTPSGVIGPREGPCVSTAQKRRAVTRFGPQRDSIWPAWRMEGRRSVVLRARF